MKKLPLIVMAFSGFVNAHSMLPGEIKEYVVQPTNKYTITLSNHYKKSMCYEVTENGEASMMGDVCLAEGAKKDLVIFVYTKPDDYGTKRVCTSPRIDGNIKVKMCSTIKNYFPASSLSQ